MCAGALGSLTGCGGGSGTGSTTTSTSAKSLTLGEASIQYLGELKPAVAVSSNGVTVEGMGGAKVTQFSLIPTAENKNSVITYGQDFHLQTLFAAETSVITGENAIAYYPRFNSGGQIVFLGFDGSNNNTYQAYTCRYDGSSLTHLFGSANLQSAISMFPSGTKVVYSNGANVYTNNTGGTAETLLTAGVEPALSVDGNTVAFVKAVGGYNQIFTIPAVGGASTQISTLSSYNCSNPRFSYDGKWVIFDVDTGSIKYLAYQPSSGSGAFASLTGPTTAGTLSNPCFSPDGKYVMYNYSASYPAGTDNSLYIQPAGGGPQTLVASGGLDGDWSPFLQKKTFVGSGGSMFTTASGFLWTELQGSMESVLAFSATTPSDASVTPETVDGSSSQIMHISADSITGLKFTNSYYAAATTIIPGTQSAVSDALVSVDGTLGTIDTIAPFVATRTVTKPSKSIQGGNIVYSGKFLGVWNKGRNVAPNGASQVVLNPKTGKLVSFD